MKMHVGVDGKWNSQPGMCDVMWCHATLMNVSKCWTQGVEFWSIFMAYSYRSANLRTSHQHLHCVCNCLHWPDSQANYFHFHCTLNFFARCNQNQALHSWQSQNLRKIAIESSSTLDNQVSLKAMFMHVAYEILVSCRLLEHQNYPNHDCTQCARFDSRFPHAHSNQFLLEVWCRQDVLNLRDIIAMAAE